MSTPAGGDAEDDVTIASCAKDPASGKAVMKIDVTNNTGADATYTFSVTIVAGPDDTSYATTPAYPVEIIDSLPPGETVSVERTTTLVVKNPVECRIDDLKRT